MPFQPFFVGQHVSVGDVLARGRLREVDSLGDRVVRRALKGGLHFHVPFRRNLVRGDGARPDFSRDFLDFTQVGAFGEFFHERLGVKTAVARRFFKIGIDLDEGSAVEYGLGIA